MNGANLLIKKKKKKRRFFVLFFHANFYLIKNTWVSSFYKGVWSVILSISLVSMCPWTLLNERTFCCVVGIAIPIISSFCFVKDSVLNIWWLWQQSGYVKSDPYSLSAHILFYLSLLYYCYLNHIQVPSTTMWFWFIAFWLSSVLPCHSFAVIAQKLAKQWHL